MEQDVMEWFLVLGCFNRFCRHVVYIISIGESRNLVLK